MNAKHTPGPWHVGGDGTVIYAPDEWAVTVSTKVYSRENPIETAEANAARIVLCVNMHDELLAALKAITELKAFALGFDYEQLASERYEIARAAIFKAKKVES